MPRPLVCSLVLSALACLGVFAAPVHASLPVPGSDDLEETEHAIEIEVTRDGATLQVTRTFTNTGPLPGVVELPIPLPCEATLDGVELRGATTWTRAQLLTTTEATKRWNGWIDGQTRADGAETRAGASGRSLDSDTALHLHRTDYGCEAQLSLYPVPPQRTRTVAYRVFVPSHYDEGRYVIGLPTFDTYGMPAQLELHDPEDPALALTVDHGPLIGPSVTLDGTRGHVVALEPRDPGRGRARVAALDLDALVAQAPIPSPAASPTPNTGAQLLSARLEIPRELAQLPPVRRVVVVLDVSHSLRANGRDQLIAVAATYLRQLADDPQQPTRAEILLFDRTARRVYHDFVPASWASEDLAKLDIETQNGSEIGDAIDHARELLAEQRELDGASSAGADWILVMSDLYLRQSFDVAAAEARAASTPERVHVIRALDLDVEFAPGSASDPWTGVARSAGGMLWEVDEDAYGLDEIAAELIAPRRLWAPTLALDFGDEAGPREQALDAWLHAGSTRTVTRLEAGSGALARASFSGEVWGQRRAWTAAPDALEGLRLAGALATHDEASLLTSEQRTALAFFAQVVSPFTSAWASAAFEGAPPPAVMRLHGFGMSGYGGSSRCGGAFGHACSAAVVKLGYAELTQPILERCQAETGRFEFETTDREIVEVDSVNGCVREGLWALDIAPARSWGRHRIRADYEAGTITKIVDDVL